VIKEEFWKGRQGVWNLMSKYDDGYYETTGLPYYGAVDRVFSSVRAGAH
jgi:hypothetical protein